MRSCVQIIVIMDAKDLRTDPALSERNNDGSKYSQSGGITLHCDKNKSYQEIGSNSLAKLDVQSSRPCAVIGPDRVVPPVVPNDVYLKKAPAEPWPPTDSAYPMRRPPDYPHKLASFQNPSRNISPRQTFQENMQRIMMPPSYNSVKLSDDTNYVQMSDRSNALTKNIKINVPSEAKFCDVPYTVYPSNNDQKSARNPEMCLPSANPTLSRTAPGWPPGNMNIRPTRMYGAPELYQYQEFPSCAGPRPIGPRPNRTVPEDQGFVYADSYYHQEGNIRFKPYPTVKDRFPQQRYEYIGNYTNSFHPPPPFPSQKYEMSKTVPPPPYPPYPAIKYLDRPPEQVMEGFHRTQQTNYNIPYRNQIIHPNYGQVISNCPQNKLHSYPPDSHIKPAGPSKVPFDTPKTYIDYESGRPKMYPTSEGYVINEMGRMHATKNQVIMPNYSTLNMHNMPPNTYYKKDNHQMRNYEYLQSHYRGMDPNMHNPMFRHPQVFSPNTSAISPTDSSASNDNLHNLVSSQEDCGYVSQSSNTSIRSMDSGIHRIPNDYLRKYYDSRFGPIIRNAPVMSKPESKSINGSKEKKNIDVRQFLQMWNEGDEETADENNSKDIIIQTGPKSDNNFGKSHQVISQADQEQLYVLGLVNVPSEELGKYEHIQKVSKLPENIKGYNHIELLNQFEEAIEFSNMTNYKTSTPKNFQVSSKMVAPKTTMGIVPPRPLSPLDVESKISQSVIHKEVGCNFEIKPCSPKMMNVEVATPVQNVLSERAIEKVANPVKLKSPKLNGIDENIDYSMLKRKDHRVNINNESVRIPSCKMINTQFSNNNSIDSIKNSYSLHDLESNSGLCLASLPRLDNDIELNFPEVNQQFINANKVDASITNSLRELPNLESLDHSETQSNEKLKDSFNQVGDILKSPCVVDTDKEFSKLSKYRKNKSLTSELKENQTYQMMNAARTDSVIIKNPENNKNYEEKTIFSQNCMNKQISDIQQGPINLTSQTTITESLENIPTKDLETALELTPIEIAIDFSVNKNNIYTNECNNDKEMLVKTVSTIESNDTTKPTTNSNQDTENNKIIESCVPRTTENKKTLLSLENNDTSKENTSIIENMPITELLLKNECLSPITAIEDNKELIECTVSTAGVNEVGHNNLLPIQFESSTTEILQNVSNNCIKSNVRETEETDNVLVNSATFNLEENINSATENLDNDVNKPACTVTDLETANCTEDLDYSLYKSSSSERLNNSLTKESDLTQSGGIKTSLENINNNTADIDYSLFNSTSSKPLLEKINNRITSDLNNDFTQSGDSKTSPENISKSITDDIDNDWTNSLSSKTPLGKFCNNIVNDLEDDFNNSTRSNSSTPSLQKLSTSLLKSFKSQDLNDSTNSNTLLKELCNTVTENLDSDMDNIKTSSTTLQNRDIECATYSEDENTLCLTNSEIGSKIDQNIEKQKNLTSVINEKNSKIEINNSMPDFPSPIHPTTNYQDDCSETISADESKPNLNTLNSAESLNNYNCDSDKSETCNDHTTLNNEVTQKPNDCPTELFERDTFNTDLSFINKENEEDYQFQTNIQEIDYNLISQNHNTTHSPNNDLFKTIGKESGSDCKSLTNNNVDESISETSDPETDFNMDATLDKLLANEVPNTSITDFVVPVKEKANPQVIKVDSEKPYKPIVSVRDSENVNALSKRYLSYGSKSMYSPYIQKLITFSEGNIKYTNNETYCSDESLLNSLKTEGRESNCDFMQCITDNNDLSDSHIYNEIGILPNIENHKRKSTYIDDNVLIKEDAKSIKINENEIILTTNYTENEPNLNDRQSQEAPESTIARDEVADIVTKTEDNLKQILNKKNTAEATCFTTKTQNQMMQGDYVDEEPDGQILNKEAPEINIHNKSKCSIDIAEIWDSPYNDIDHDTAEWESEFMDKVSEDNRSFFNSNETLSDSLNPSNNRDFNIELPEEIYMENNPTNDSPEPQKQLDFSEAVTEEALHDTDTEEALHDTDTKNDCQNAEVEQNCDRAVVKELFQKSSKDTIEFKNPEMQINYNDIEIELSKINEMTCTKTQESKLKFLNKKRQPLKRSLSDTALSSYNDNSNHETEENVQFVWPFKRRKINNIHNNLLTHDLCNIIHNNRRNSISAIYNEDNVSFCILIDDDCIIAEEDNGEQEKICYAELQEECLTEIENGSKEDIETTTEILSITQQENEEYSDSYLMQSEDEKLEETWVDDVACMETVISDDIAENIEISGQSSPNEVDSLSDNDESGVFSNTDHTDKVKYIYGEKMCSDDAQFVETLFNTPQMHVNKTLNQRESLTSNEYYDNNSLEKILSESNDQELSSHAHEYQNLVFSPKYSEMKETAENKENLSIGIIPPLKNQLSPLDIIADVVIEKNDDEIVKPAQFHDESQDETLYSCESSSDNVFTYKENDENTNYTTSSSPEVSSTTSEEKNSAILLKITNYKGSRISQINDSIRDNNRPCCKFTEDKDYVQSNPNFASNRPLLTKAAQKYIPPLKESMHDLKVKLSLPQHSLLKFKQLKKSKDLPKLCKPNVTIPRVSKKPKPKFEDVLKSLDDIQIKMHKEKNKKTKKSIPKVVIKKNEHGSHYASTSNKEEYNPDLTGRKWQPWVFIEKNHFIDKMATKKKNKAIYSHRKRTYVLAEKFKKYKSAPTANFVISPPISDCPSTSLKYTIRLKHNY